MKPARCTAFNTSASVALPALLRASPLACGCALHARRRLGGALIGFGTLASLGLGASAAQAQDDECRRSKFTQAVSAEQVEQAAGQQYRQMLQQASEQRALVPVANTQVQRLQYIAKRIIPFTAGCNPRAQQWRWDVNLIGSQELNAFCMPGGKIAFYYGILAKLQLDDDEVATIMGHEVPCTAGACPRPHGQDHGHARRDRAGRGVVRPGRRRPHAGRHGRPVADLALLARR